MYRTLRSLLLLALSTSCLAQIRYDGYEVHRIIPLTNKEIEALQQLEETRHDFNFWSGVSGVGFPVDVMVPPHLKHDFQNFILSQNLNSELWISNVQERIDLGKKQTPERSADYDWDDYKTLEEINTWLDSLVEKYPGIVTSIVGGRSYEGREIRGVKVSFGRAKKGVLIEGGIHACEWISPATVTYILNQILTNPDPKIRAAVESRDWHIFPSINPDGYVYTHVRNRLWRKTRKPHGLCKGADPNRNWDYHWMDGGAANISCLPTYAGSSPFSETETKSFSEYIKSVADSLDIYLAFHSYFQLFLIPYGHKGLEKPENNDELHRIANVAARSLVNRHGTRYLVGNVPETIYTASGSSIDWVKANFKNIRIVYTIELRDTGKYGFLLPPAQILPTGEETFDAVVAIVNQANEINPF